MGLPELEKLPASKCDEEDAGPMDEEFLSSLVSGSKRARNPKIDRMICQTIARCLWDEYKDISIEAMKKHAAIRIYGNGRSYYGKNTLRGWLSAVDPRDPATKGGRRKNKSSEEPPI
jgi:hypothetical protein